MQKQCDNVILELTVRNHPGVMTHVCGLFARRAFNVEGILCLPIQGSEHSRIWLLVNDDQRLGQMISQIEKLEDVTKVARNQSDPTMFNKIAVFFEYIAQGLNGKVLMVKVSAFAGWRCAYPAYREWIRRPDKAFTPPSGAFRHQETP